MGEESTRHGILTQAKTWHYNLSHTRTFNLVLKTAQLATSDALLATTCQRQQTMVGHSPYKQIRALGGKPIRKHVHDWALNFELPKWARAPKCDAYTGSVVPTNIPLLLACWWHEGSASWSRSCCAVCLPHLPPFLSLASLLSISCWWMIRFFSSSICPFTSSPLLSEGFH